MSNKKIPIISKDYFVFLKEIKDKITKARITAYKSLNKGLIKLYWDIGKTIVEKQEKYGWGESVVEKLSKDLMNEFKGQNGFSANNLWRMRNFYLTYKDDLKLAQLVQEIPWGQNIVIMQRIKEQEVREYYIQATIQYAWSRDILIHQIEAEAHKQEKIKKIHNFPKTLSSHLSEQADLAMKDTYILDFLDIAQPLLERDLERKFGFVRNLFNKISLEPFEYYGQYIPDTFKQYINKYERVGKYTAPACAGASAGREDKIYCHNTRFSQESQRSYGGYRHWCHGADRDYKKKLTASENGIRHISQKNIYDQENCMRNNWNDWYNMES